MIKSIKKIQPLPVTAYTAVSNCGVGKQALYEGLVEGETKLKSPQLFDVDFPAFVGEVNPASLPQLRSQLADYTTRNTQIALAGLNFEADQLRPGITRAVKTYGNSRVGIVLGTSTSGIYETENAYFSMQNQGRIPVHYDFSKQHVWAATSRFLRQELELKGPCYVISTACSSSSKSIAAAQRLIACDVCDAVITGGVDSLCRMTLNGFNSLELICKTPCTPLDQNRAGISLGEGAGLLLLERSSEDNAHYPHLLGSGESSDAYHMTAPHPQGKGAEMAMTHAFSQAGLKPAHIDYLNLHATGTQKNDQAELIAVKKVFGNNIACSGTKGLTGHTLGAAGGVEAVIALLALEHNFKPGTCGLEQVDTQFECTILKHSQLDVPVTTVMSNNYGFGGNNASLIFGRRL